MHDFFLPRLMIDAHRAGSISLLSVVAPAMNDDNFAAELSPSGRARRDKNNVWEDVCFRAVGSLAGSLVRLPKIMAISRAISKAEHVINSRIFSTRKDALDTGVDSSTSYPASCWLRSVVNGRNSVNGFDTGLGSSTSSLECCWLRSGVDG